MKGQKVLAYTCCILRSIIYGTSILFTSNLLDNLHFTHMLALRFLISAVAFTLMQLVGIIKIDFRGKPIKFLLITALFEPVGYFIFEAIGIAGTSTSLAGILAAATSIMVLIFERIFLKERTSLAQKLLLVLSVGGVVLVTIFSGGGGHSSIVGIVFLMLANMSGALFVISSRKSSSTQFSAMEVTYFAAIVGAIVFNAINLVVMINKGTLSTFFTPLCDLKTLLAFVFLSVLSTILATLMTNYAISKIQPSSVSALGALSTVVTIAVGVIFKGDELGWYHVVGTALILCGSVGINYLTQKKASAKSLQEFSE